MSTSDPLALVLSRLHGVKPAGKGNFVARCPAHEDRRASLSIGTGHDGRILLRCHAGCEVGAICGAIGLAVKELFPASNGNGHPTGYIGQAHRATRAQAKPKAAHPTAEAAIEAARRGVGPAARVAGTWQYPEAGMRVVRIETDEGKQFRPIHETADGWHIGDPEGPLVLYRLSTIANAPRVYVCEGEKAADAAASIGLTATTSAHGSQAAQKTDWSPLAGKEVIILPDNDEPGRKYAAEVSEILRGLNPPAAVGIVALPGLPSHGDMVEFLETRDSQDSESIVQEIAKLADAAVAAGDDSFPQPKSVRELVRVYPKLREPVIHGLTRRGETMNVIAPSKTGKSWLVIDLAIAQVTGRMWLGQYQTEPGPVLVIDNELHGETSAHRIPRVAEARGVLTDEFADRLTVLNLRGHLHDIFSLESFFRSIKADCYKLVILDAFYRFMPRGTDENDNATMAGIYNHLDRLADRLGCCFVLIHHSSKGNQADKAITDVGAGAGAQARATDTHLVLRQHEEDDAVVLDAAVRSWAPANPVCLRWSFPVWNLAPELDPTALRRPGRPAKRKEGDPQDTPAADWTADSFVASFITPEPKPKSIVLAEAELQGLPERKAEKLLKLAEATGKACRWVGNRTQEPRFATLAEPKAGGGR